MTNNMQAIMAQRRKPMALFCSTELVYHLYISNTESGIVFQSLLISYYQLKREKTKVFLIQYKLIGIALCTSAPTEFHQ